MKSYFTSKGAALAPQSLAHADRLLSALGIRTNLCGVCGTKTQDQVCKDCMDKDANYEGEPYGYPGNDVGALG